MFKTNNYNIVDSEIIMFYNVRGIGNERKERSYLTISRNIHQVTQLFAFRKHILQKRMYSCGNINGMVI